ncbi:MAG: hypothetical protein HY692_01000 [Cyanobacteria bacterium NC_groundwater_1444_Ag_S-0.65um_54_12]|nr:hypothetical protein [Cyanobacteria bacterium NC_groundwater_1444_Ag_S-0.65um_54_12]
MLKKITSMSADGKKTGWPVSFGTLRCYLGAWLLLLGAPACSNPMIATTSFDLVLENKPGIVWSASGKAPFVIWTAAYTPPAFGIRNLQGPPITIEAIQIFTGDRDTPDTFALKSETASGSLFTLGGFAAVYNLVDDSRPNPGDTIPFPINVATGSTPPLNGRILGYQAVVLWKNRYGQANFTGGVFDSQFCFCYTDAGPRLKSNKELAVPDVPTPHQGFTFEIKYESKGS